MKKKIVFTIAILICIISIIFNVFQYILFNELKKNMSEKSAYSDLYKILPSLTIKNFEEKVKNGDRFAIYAGRPNCGDCINFEPNLFNIFENYNLNSNLYYVNVYWLRNSSEEAYKKFKLFYGYDQTPVFLLFEDGKLESKIEWSDQGLTESNLIEWLIKNNLIS